MSSSSKKSEKQLSKGYNARKKPLYHNCKLIAPDDELLCTCDVKKALWYVDKGLGGEFLLCDQILHKWYLVYCAGANNSFKS